MGKHTIRQVAKRLARPDEIEQLDKSEPEPETTESPETQAFEIPEEVREPKVNIFNREPAQWLGLIAAAIQLVSALFFPLTIEQQGTLNAIAVAVFGLLTALAVSEEKAAPLVGGFIQALLACALAFGAHLSPEMQSSAMAFVTAAVALFMRTQVVAPGRPVASITGGE